MSVDRVAAEHYARSEGLTKAVTARLLALWDQTGPSGFRDVADLAAGVLAAGQYAAAASSADYVAAAAAEQGATAAAPVAADPRAFSGLSAAGDVLSNVVQIPSGQYWRAVDAGADPVEAALSARASLSRIAANEVQTAGTTAAAVSITGDERILGYTRLLRAPSCARCVVLAGRHYKAAEAFRRHPRCDCKHVPRVDAEGLTDGTSNPYDYFERLSEAEQNALLGKDGAKAVRDGANMSHVVNIRSRGVLYDFGMGDKAAEMTTYKGLWGRANPGRRRLSPGGCYQLANGDRDKALALLARNGYLTGAPGRRLPDVVPDRPAVRIAPAVPEVPAAAVREVDELGYYSRDEWPDWARRDLAPILDELPADRTMIGVKPFDVDKHMLNEFAKYRGWGSWDELEAAAATMTPRKLRALRAALNKADDIETRHKRRFVGSADELSPAQRAKRLEYESRRNDAYREWDRAQYLAGDVKMRDAILTRSTGNAYIDSTVLPPESHMALYRSMRTVDVDDVERMSPEFSADFDRVLKVGEAVEAEALRRVEARGGTSRFLAELLRDDDPRAPNRVAAKMLEAGVSDPFAAMADFAGEWRSTVLEVMSEVRPMGSRSTAGKIFAGLDDAIRDTVIEVTDHYPTSWIDTLLDVVGEGKYKGGRVERGFHNFYTRELAISGSGTSARATALHEVGHAMQNVVGSSDDPGSGSALMRLDNALASRRVRRLGELGIIDGNPQRIYGGSDEFAIRSTFRNPYTAKTYEGHRLWSSTRMAGTESLHEVFTTGVQSALPYEWHHVGRFSDIEFRRYIFGVMLYL